VRRGEAVERGFSAAERKNGVFFVVGPEGGLSPEEVESAKERGFIPLS